MAPKKPDQEKSPNLKQHWRYSAVIVRRTTVAEKTFELEVEIQNAEFTFQPGQYLWLVVPKLKFLDPRGNRRAFSISSAPNNKRRVTFLIRENNSGFNRTLRAIPLKSVVECLGPFGSSFTLPDGSTERLLIAGGMGVAPFLSLLRDLPQSSTPRLTLLWYNSSEARIPYREEIQRIVKDRPEITVVYLSQIFSIGDVPTRLRRAIWCISGPQEMINAVAQTASENGVDQQQLRFEQHYPQTPGGQELASQLRDLSTSTELEIEQVATSSNTIQEMMYTVLPKIFLLAGCVSVAVGCIYYFLGEPVLLNFTTAALLFLARLTWRKPSSRIIITNIVLAGMFLMFLGIALNGGTDDYGIYWVGIFPLFAMLLRPRFGLWWSGAFILAIFAYGILERFGLNSFSYSSEVYFQEGMYLLLVTGVATLFLRVYFQLERRLVNSVRQEKIFHKAITSSSNHVIITDHNGIILYANAAAQRITGYTFNEMIGNTPRLWGGLMSENYYRRLWRAKLSGQTVIDEVTNHRKNHELYTAIAHITPITHPTYGIIGFVATEEEITKMKDRESELERLNNAMIGRELKMIELKERLRELEQKKS